MIVNTAYIYMGNGGGAAVNPNLWQDGVSNYPVVFTGGCSISYAGLDFTSAKGNAIFSELPLKDFNSLTLSGRLKGASASTQTNIGIGFYNRDNVLIGTTSAKITTYGDTVAVGIPSSAKIQNAKIKIKKDITHGFNLTLSSAVLS